VLNTHTRQNTYIYIYLYTNRVSSPMIILFAKQKKRRDKNRKNSNFYRKKNKIKEETWVEHQHSDRCVRKYVYLAYRY